MLIIDDNKGFTLIEVLAAMVILSVGLLGTAALITGIVKGNKTSNQTTTATVLAQDKIEDITRSGYSTAVPEAKAFLPSPYNQYEMEVTVTPNSPATGMKTVTVEVFWESSKSVTLKTILSG